MSARVRLGRGAILSRQALRVGPYEVELVRKNITRCHLYVRSATGPLLVSAPARMGVGTIEGFVTAHAEWIERRRRELGASGVARGSSGRDHMRVDGTVSLWGAPTDALRVLDESGIAARRARAVIGSRGGCASLEGEERAQVNAALREAMRAQCRRRAVPLVRTWEARMGVSAASVRVHDTVSRWGSCNLTSHDVNFSLWLAHYPEPCLEQVVVHELTHLLEGPHDERFYAIMTRYLPDWRERRDLLRRLSRGA